MSTSVFALAVGQCLNVPIGDEVTDVGQVPCAQEHDAEVFALPQHPAERRAPYPGVDVVDTWADEACYQAFAGYVGAAYEESILYYQSFTPTEGSWTQREDREVVCMLVGEDFAPLTGTYRGTGI